MSAGLRGTLGVANFKGDSRPGGGVWQRERGELFRPAEYPWHLSQSKEAGVWLVEVGDRGRAARNLPLQGRQGQYGGEVQGGLCNPCNLPSGLRSSWGNERGRRCSS